jgi:hypothetical protein
VPDDELPPGGTLIGADPIWDAWTPSQVSRLLAGADAHWAVAGGWAIDLFLGVQTRAHEDLEITVPAAEFWAVRAALAAYDVAVIHEERSWPLDSPVFGDSFRTWVRDPATGEYRLDIFRERHDGDLWICRRDESIRRPYDQVIRRDADGIPYVAPEIILLFKAKHARPKDQADLDHALRQLDPRARDWLGWALRRVHPGHPWVARVASGSHGD